PTGTAIAIPVSVTSCPRTRPSVVSIATVRTVDSPSCWATSSTRRLPWLVVSSALRIAGRCSRNLTSTTAPMIWVMCPTGFVIIVLVLRSARGLQRLGAGDDLDQFLGDHRLAGAVVGQGPFADHVAGIAGGVVHRGHLRTVEGGGILHQRTEDLHRDVAGQKIGENVLFVGLVFVDGAAVVTCAFGKHRRDKLLCGRNLRHHRTE